jgi:hypothetical protein
MNIKVVVAAGAWMLSCGSARDAPGVGGVGGIGDAGSGAGGSLAGAAGGGGASAGAGGQGSGMALAPVDKLDVLFMIDNSISMNDKQEILGVAVPDLVSRLTNPVCVDDAGNVFPAPAPGADCASGQRREFEPLLDVHVGVVSSSLGDAGANVACPQEGAPRYEPDRVDMAHLLGSLPRGQNPSANAQGFLEWRAGSTDVSAFNRDVEKMVTDVGDNGCGFESQLESWYRFLVDPFPYQSLVRVPCTPGGGLDCVQPATDAMGNLVVDDVLLAQRAAFLRPDSLLLVVMLSDENDCSAMAAGWRVFAIDDSRPMFRGSSMCDQNPNDKCCYTCPVGPPAGCAADPICDADPETGALEDRLPANLDGQNVRCVDQKRRFGVSALYPTERYVNALREPTLCWNRPDLSPDGCPPADRVPNPLFEGGRPAERVFLAGIVGVPWQAIAADVDPANRPLPSAQLRFQSPEELRANGVWDSILGSPGVPWRAPSAAQPEVIGLPPIPPSLPQMVESMEPRPGVAPGNPINGREHDTVSSFSMRPDDLEFACIFPLAQPRDCTLADPTTEPCACYAGQENTALCEQTPGVSAPGTTQYWAKAYPSLRQLEVLKGHGDQSIVASICARNVTDASAADFGYRPAMAAIVERVRGHLP